MSGMLETPNQKFFATRNEKEEFKNEVLFGLLKPYKKLSSKYFYNKRGCELFNQISHHPDYYLTNCELEILNKYKKDLSQRLSSKPFNLVELGPGEGTKTSLLIEQFLHDGLSFTYLPIDISKNYLNALIKQFNKNLPKLEVIALQADYFDGLKWLNLNSSRQNFVMFLGSSIGNFDLKATKTFLSHLWQNLHDGDYVFIGFDLRKDIDVILRAYNDSDGLTSNFNLNLLQRINDELGANFVLNKFRHYETYNVCVGAMESYLVSCEAQVIDIDALRRSFVFQPYEAIHVEYSFKYLLSQIKKFAHVTGFEIIKTYTDSKEYFVDSLWQVKK